MCLSSLRLQRVNKCWVFWFLVREDRIYSTEITENRESILRYRWSEMAKIYCSHSYLLDINIYLSSQYNLSNSNMLPPILLQWPINKYIITCSRRNHLIIVPMVGPVNFMTAGPLIYFFYWKKSSQKGKNVAWIVLTMNMIFHKVCEWCCCRKMSIEANINPK